MSDDTKMRARIEIIVGWLRQGAWQVGAETAAEAADAIERLERELAEAKGAGAAELDLLIASRTHFTGDEPYVGWKGLALALREDFDRCDALGERCEKLLNSIKMARDAELFEDGCAADLRDAGISTLSAAYMRGRLDCLDEIEANGRSPRPDADGARDCEDDQRYARGRPRRRR